MTMTFEMYLKYIYAEKHQSCYTAPKKSLHFDYTLSPKIAFKLVSNPKNIEKHWFLPLMAYTLSVRKTNRTDSKITRKNKVRPIRYASNRDNYIYTYYSFLFSQKYEFFLANQVFQTAPLAYRTLGKNNIDFAKMVFDTIKKIENCTVVCIDLSSFFDTLDHGILKRNLLKVLGKEDFSADEKQVFQSITKYSFFEKDEVIQYLGWTLEELKLLKIRTLYEKGKTEQESFQSLKKLRKAKNSHGDWLIKRNPNLDENGKMIGVPQGVSLSAVLSNIYMIDFDQHADAYAKKNKGYYVRYCDDILVILPGYVSYKEIILQITQLLEQHAGKSLKINHNKTEAIYFNKKNKIQQLQYINLVHPEKNYELQYLGFNFNGKRIILRQSSLARYYRKLSSKINTTKRRASKNKNNAKPYLRSIYRKYSMVSNAQQTFIDYAKRASTQMGESSISKQLKLHMKFIKKKANQLSN